MKDPKPRRALLQHGVCYPATIARLQPALNAESKVVLRYSGSCGVQAAVVVTGVCTIACLFIGRGSVERRQSDVKILFVRFSSCFPVQSFLHYFLPWNANYVNGVAYW